MRTRNSSKIVAIFFIAIISSLYYGIRLIDNDSYVLEGAFLVFCNIFMWICLGLIVSKRDFYMFEPIVFVFFLYYMIFVFEPINNILNENVAEFGVNTMRGCVKATIIFIFSFVFMLLGYYSKSAIKDKYIITSEASKEFVRVDADEKFDRHSLLKYSWIVWSVGIATFLIYNTFVGRSPIYMLSFGLRGRGDMGAKGYDVLILSVIIYISFYPLMNILVYGRSNTLKVLALIITCAPLATRGFRNILVVVISAPVLFHYIKKRETPSIAALAVFFVAFIFIFGFIGSTRGATRIGKAVDLSNYEYSDGLDGMLYYFDSYKVFYGAVTQYPQNYSYTYGMQLFYSIIMFIPRFLWSGKPDPLIREVIGRSVGPLSASSGSAWPNIGEYYTDLGIIGTFVCMFVLGRILNKMKAMYSDEENNNGKLMLYCLYLPALVTIIAYGYTAGNAPQYLLMALPYLLRRYFVQRA